MHHAPIVVDPSARRGQITPTRNLRTAHSLLRGHHVILCPACQLYNEAEGRVQEEKGSVDVAAQAEGLGSRSRSTGASTGCCCCLVAQGDVSVADVAEVDEIRVRVDAV